MGGGVSSIPILNEFCRWLFAAPLFLTIAVRKLVFSSAELFSDEQLLNPLFDPMEGLILCLLFILLLKLYEPKKCTTDFC